MEVGRRKKEEAVIAMVSVIKNVLTVLAVAIAGGMLCLDPPFVQIPLTLRRISHYFRFNTLIFS
jgi:hypothetical protein